MRFGQALKIVIIGIMSPSPFRLSLRDVLWLTLLVAEVVAAVQTHYRDENELQYWRRESARSMDRGNVPYAGQFISRPMKDVLAERETLKTLPDDELITRLEEEVSKALWNDLAYEYCLSELARRKLTVPLERHYQQIIAAKPPERWRLPSPSAALVALRRSQGQPDPLRIQLEVAETADAPEINIVVKNREMDNQNFLTDVESPNSGHWQIVLTSNSGQSWTTSDQFHVQFYRLAGARMAPIDTIEWKSVDLRKFVAPPPSGDYQVRLFYHERYAIAYFKDIDGLVCFQSEPLAIRVHNPDDPQRLSLEGAIPLAVALLPLGLLVSGWIIARRTGNRAILWRDGLWCFVILIVGAAWFIDQQSLWQEIRAAIPHESATWTIEAMEA
jgi:hypothetical protein